VRFLEYIFYHKGSGGPQKAFSSLSEGLRGIFTINTEAGERTYVPHLLILGATTMSSWSVVRADILQELLLVTHFVTLGRR
jgi:hypothetical protein